MSTRLGTLLRGKSRNGRSAAEDGLEDERREMIAGIEELSVTTVKEVMVPRTDTVFLPITATRDEVLDIVIGSGHSRIPVHRDTVDDIAGILYAKDLLEDLRHGAAFSLSSLLRPPFFVPETKRIDTLLREFRRRRVHIAIAVDEYGSVSGIVCLEDILEEIVGEIQDEFDDEADTLIRSADGSWLCEARMDLDDLNERLGLDLPEDEFDSLGGYVVSLFGRIPERGESIESEGLRFTIHTLQGHRVTRVLLSPLVAPEPGSES